MRINPVGEKVVVIPVKTERVTEGGILIPESEAERYYLASIKAKIVAIGALAFQAEKQHEKEFGVDVSHGIPRPGQTVAIAKYAGYEIEVDGEKMRVITDSDITAILEEKEDGRLING